MTMETLDQIKLRIEAGVPAARLEIVRNDSPSTQHSLLVDNEHTVAVAKFLRDDPELQLDYCSNVTGVDWPDIELTEKVKIQKIVDGVEKEVEEVKKTKRPGYLEAVYHLYSMSLKHGPVIIRVRTGNRGDMVHLPSLTPVWRGCEFQENKMQIELGEKVRRAVVSDNVITGKLRIRNLSSRQFQISNNATD